MAHAVRKDCSVRLLHSTDNQSSKSSTGGTWLRDPLILWGRTWDLNFSCVLGVLMPGVQ